MTTVYDVEPKALIDKAAEELKKDSHIKPLAWTPFVKTGVHKQQPPFNPDWWYVRAAAVLRSVYISKRPIGVSKMRTKYGGKQYGGVRPGHFQKGSGSVARKILQQLQAGGYVKLNEKGLRKGRIISGKGRQLLDDLAHKIAPRKILKVEVQE